MSINLADLLPEGANKAGLQFGQGAMVEQATNRSRSLSNLARAALLLGRPEAATLARNALELAQRLPPSDSQRRATAAAAYALCNGLSRAGTPRRHGQASESGRDKLGCGW